MTAAALSNTDTRRAHQRIGLAIELTLEGDDNFFTGFTENISEGGLFVATHMAREVGEHLALELALPGGGEPIRVTCEVRWLRTYSETSDFPPGMGLRFLDLREADRLAITDFLTHRAPLFWDE